MPYTGRHRRETPNPQHRPRLPLRLLRGTPAGGQFARNRHNSDTRSAGTRRDRLASTKRRIRHLCSGHLLSGNGGETHSIRTIGSQSWLSWNVLRVGAANLDGLPSAGANLTDEDRAAIEASLSALGRVRFVSSRSDFFDNNVRGSALLMLAPVVVEDQRVARVGATLQCEGHCAVWTTIDVISTDGEWHAVSDGPRTIS